MAYTKSNEIMTRISLKYDSYENWSSKNPVLLKGEVAIATIAKTDSNTTATKLQNLPNVIMKVGDGETHYNDLKFVSGLAADVYDWAKAASKPSYGISEISGALEYQLATIDAATYKYQLQARKAGSSDEWAKVSDLDLSGIDSRLDTVEGKVQTIEGDLNTTTTGLKDRMTAAETAIANITKGEGGAIGTAITAAIEALDVPDITVGADSTLSVVGETDGLIHATPVKIQIAQSQVTDLDKALDAKLDKTTYNTFKADEFAPVQEAVNNLSTTIANAINALDATKDQTAGADGLSLHIKEENGIITEFSGSIAANTYDAYGAGEAAAKAVQGDTTKTIKENVDAIGVINGTDAGKSMREVATAVVEGLDYNAYEAGNATGATISFVGTVSESNGVISATKRDLVFNSAYDPSTNKAATMADVTGAVADLNGAMHFEGVYDEMPTDLSGFSAGDVIIVGLTEYVFSNGAFVQLGDEGAIAAALKTLTQVEVGAANKTLKVKQENGKVTATEVEIEIAQSQVSGLTDRLSAIEGELDNGAEGSLAKQVAANKAAIDVINDKDAGKSMRTVAAEEALKATQNLDVADIAVGADSTLTLIGQTDGSIHATPVKIQIAQDQVTGLPSALAAKLDVETFNTFKTSDFKPVKDSVDTLKGDVNTEGSVAKSISDAVANLSKENAAQDGKYISAITQANGIVTASYADLPVIPDLALTHATSATEPTEAEVVVVGDLSVSGHTITDTHVKVATKAGVNAAIKALDSSKEVSTAKHVMTGITQVDGVLDSFKEVELADIAFSGNVADLKQTANTYVVFNCGTAEINI